MDLFPAYSDDSPLCELLVWSPHRSLKKVYFCYISLGRQCLIYPFFLTSERAGLCEQATVRTVGVFLVPQLPSFLHACITHVTGDTHGPALYILEVHGLARVRSLNLRANVSLHGCSCMGSLMSCLLYQRINWRIDGHLASGHVADGHYPVPTACWFVVVFVHCVFFFMVLCDGFGSVCNGLFFLSTCGCNAWR